MKHVLIMGILFFASVNPAFAAQGGFGPGTMPDPNAKQGLTGMVVQPQTAKINQKLQVKLFSYLPPGEKCEVYFNYPGLQYGPVKLLVAQSPYTVPAQYQPVFKQAGEYVVHAYTGTTGEHPCPQGKNLKTKVTIEDMTRFSQPPVVTKPHKFNTPGPLKPQAPARQTAPKRNTPQAEAVRRAPASTNDEDKKIAPLGRYPLHMHQAE
jgi:hypothetical protein